MKRHLFRLVPLTGALVAAWIVYSNHPTQIWALLKTAGVGLIAASAAHLVPMIASAGNWRPLIRETNRPSLLCMLRIVWIRESINALLPVARIGGEFASFHLLRREGIAPAAAVASIVVDMQLGLISQVLFILVGVSFLFAQTQSDSLRLAAHLAQGVATLIPVVLGFSVLQHAKPFRCSHVF